MIVCGTTGIAHLKVASYYLAFGYQEIKFEIYVHPMLTILEIPQQVYFTGLNIFSKLLFPMRSEGH